MEGIIALVGVVLGWMLGQVTELLKDVHGRKKKLKMVYMELSGLKEWIELLLKRCRLSLQLSSLGKRAFGSPNKLYAPLLEKYYSDIYMDLHSDSRQGLTNVSDSINFINGRIESLKEKLDAGDMTIDHYATIVEVIFRSAYSCLKMIELLQKMDRGELSENIEKKYLISGIEDQIKNEFESMYSDARKLGEKKLFELYNS